MKSITLPRTGMTPIRFTGEILSHVSGRDLPKCESRQRWHELTLYRTDSDRFILHAAFRAETRYETDNDQVRVFDTLFLAAQWLWQWHATRNCLAAVQGWQLERHRERDAALRRDLLNQMSSLITKLVEQVPQAAEVV